MRKLILAAAAILVVAAILFGSWPSHRPTWTPAELATIRSLSLAALPTLPPDPSNAVADDPDAMALGGQIFFDPRFSANGQVSCATCHVPALYFTDGKPLGQGVGTIKRHTMSLVGSAYSPWYTWDGKADSLWAQAILPLEHAAEHAGDRLSYARTLAKHYGEEYRALFGPLPDLWDSLRFGAHASPGGNAGQQSAWRELAASDQEAITRVAVNMSKALAAYQRTLLPEPARFDRYVAALDRQGNLPAGASDDSRLTADEIAGLRLFLGKGQCINCHNGPLLTNFEFHNTGVPGVPGLPLDHGRRDGVVLLRASEFTCLGSYSDAAANECGEIRFLPADSNMDDGKFRTPTLRNVAETAPYMHAGQYATLREVVEHYNRGGNALLGHNELVPLELSEQEVVQLEAFLATLTGAVSRP
jgi:cytochrome c peroxidase